MTAVDLDSVWKLDGHDQAQLVRSGTLGAPQLVEASLARIEALNPVFNAVCHVARDHAFEAAGRVDQSADMAGVPCLLKASMEYPGFPHVSGSRSRTEVTGRSLHPFGKALNDAGLIACGITTMPEFGLIGSGEALVYGPTRNPWDTRLGAGGSSSGAGVAVATGMAAFATGSDGGGSIRIPASHTGVVGFKPSRNWNLRARGPGLIDDLLASDGLLTRSMRDAVWAAHQLRQQPPAIPDIDAPLRIAVSLRGLDGLLPDDDITDVIQRTADLCEHLGHHVSDVGPLIDYDAANHAFDVLWSYGAGEVADLTHARLGLAAADQLEPWTLGLADRRKMFSPDDLANALRAVAGIDDEMSVFWNEFDIVLSPVTSNLPPAIGTLAPDREFDALWRDHFRHVNYTQLQNMAGYPGLSLPLFLTEAGLPAGSMFWGPYGSDDLLLSLGLQLENASPWARRWPPAIGA